ncbi:MAG TPA: hypothetical protein ENK58_08470 [Desulfobacterales bacterium]|nr:hypothetical protein [Desulfobacterales bacterium]
MLMLILILTLMLGSDWQIRTGERAQAYLKCKHTRTKCGGFVNPPQAYLKRKHARKHIRFGSD